MQNGESQQYEMQQYQHYNEVPHGKQKSLAAAAVLAFFFTWCGAANFYLGYKKTGFLQLGLDLGGLLFMVLGHVVVRLSTGLLGLIIFITGAVFVLSLAIWGLVDFIRILAEKPPMNKDSNGIPLK